MNLQKSGVSNNSKSTNAIINLSSFSFVKQSVEHVVPTRIQLEFTSESQAASENCTAASPSTTKQSEASSGQSQHKSEGMEETIAPKYGRRVVLGGTRLGSEFLSEHESETSSPNHSRRLLGLSTRLTKCGGTRTSREDDPEGVAGIPSGKIRRGVDEQLFGCKTGCEVITSRSLRVESTDAVPKADVLSNPKNGTERKQSSSPRKCSIDTISSNPKVSQVCRLFTECAKESGLEASSGQLSRGRFNSGEASNELLSCSTQNKDAWSASGVSTTTGDVLWRKSSFRPRQVLKRKRSAPDENSRSVHAVDGSQNANKIEITRSEPFSRQQKLSSPTSSGSPRAIDGNELSIPGSRTSTIAGDAGHGSLSTSITESSISGGRRNISIKTCSFGSPSSTSPHGSFSTTIDGSSSTILNGPSSTSLNGSSSTSLNESSTITFNESSSTTLNESSSTTLDGSPSTISQGIAGCTRSTSLPTGRPLLFTDERPLVSREQSPSCAAQSSWQSRAGTRERQANVHPRPETSPGASSEASPAGASHELPPAGDVGVGGAAGPTPSCVLAERQSPAPATPSSVASGQGQGREGEATPTLEDAKCIQAIDKTAVHRICSGQVVVNLATAVKELVENSLDAGSRSVEVRLTGHGAASLVVSDDGPGVHPKDFEALALKHHTSKLRDFSEVCGVATYGFRGEALSSLCALSVLSVCTRHASQPLASHLTYDRDGRLVQHKPASRQVGTTVTLNDLFTSLPVRRREFERNLKKEYHKMLQVLYSYAIISTNIRLHVVNQADGRRNTVLSTSCFGSVRDNIEALYGAKQMKTLLALEERVALSSEDEADDAAPSTDGGDLRLEGFISSCCHGSGRSAPDRQFYFVNNRPCDPVKVSRLVNEVYHTYNRHQYPFVVLNILMERRSVDVNLTPDKRQVMMHNEKLLLTTIKNSLFRLYEDIPNTLPLYNSTSLISPSQKQKSNSAQKQSKLSLQIANNETSSMASDKRSRKNIMTLNSMKHVLAHDNAHDDSFPSDSADSERVASSIPPHHLTAHTVGVTRSPSQTLSRRLHVSKNSPRLAMLAQKGNEAGSSSNTLGDASHCSDIEEVNCISGPLQSSQKSTLKHSNAATNMCKYSEEITSKIDSQTFSSTISHNESHASTQNIVDHLAQKNQNTNSCSSEDPIKHNTEDERSKGHKFVAAGTLPMNTDLEPQISCRNYDTSSPCSKRDHSFEELLPSPKKKRSCFHLKRDELKENGSSDTQVTDHFSGLTESLDGFSEETSLPHSDEADGIDEKPQTCASSKRNSMLHDATSSFLARLTSKTVQASKTKDNDDVRKSLRKFVFKKEQDQKENVVPAEPKNCPTESSCSKDAPSFNECNALCSPNSTQDTTPCDDLETLVCYDEFNSNNCNRRTKLAHVSLDNLREIFAKRNRNEGCDKKKVAARNFHAKIAPSDNRAAEAELNKVLSKDMFAKMKILGQFNLGFLITQLESDLFIIDQHATDEKYNFETLQQTCVLRHQPLIQPQSLQLTPANETILIDNINIFSANGFQFDVNESLPFGERVKLKSVPQSRNWSFGKDDIEELIFMLSDAPGAMCRPSRVRAMFASRACRTSVMVGTALSRSQMRDLVDHMGQIEQPWNCPHGRPTVRHLINLDMISK